MRYAAATLGSGQGLGPDFLWLFMIFFSFLFGLMVLTGHSVAVEAIPARTARAMFDIFTHFSGPHFAFCHCLYQHNAVGMTTPKIASALFSRSWEPWRCLDLTWITGGTMLRLSNTYIIHNPTHCILFLVFFFFFFFCFSIVRSQVIFTGKGMTWNSRGRRRLFWRNCHNMQRARIFFFGQTALAPIGNHDDDDIKPLIELFCFRAEKKSIYLFFII